MTPRGQIPAKPEGKLKLAAFKFSSCDGCQLQVLNLEDALLDLADAVEIAFFLEARRRKLPPPYDIGLVEGSISTPEEEERIRQIRRDCRHAGHDRGLCHLGRHPGAAQLGRRRGVRPLRLRPARVSLTRSTPRRRLPPTCSSTSSCGAARSTPQTCWSWSRRCWWGGSRTSPRTACASTASGGAIPACWWPRASRAWARSPRSAAGRSARPTTAPATAVSALWSNPTWPRWAAGSPTARPVSPRHEAACSASSTATWNRSNRPATTTNARSPAAGDDHDDAKQAAARGPSSESHGPRRGRRGPAPADARRPRGRAAT